VIGGNGTGKTTLLRTLLGEIRECSGRVVWGTKTDVGYYSQSLDDLHEGNTVISELRRVAPKADNGELRSFLARFLFFGDDVAKFVSTLSGGEKGRLALAKLIYSQKNVLILDEPTNHLDIPAREALESALDEYPGTIITVSHDRFFLDRIATQILSFESDGRVLDYNGNYTEFRNWRERKTVSPQNGRSGESERPKNAGVSQDRRILSKNQRERLEKRIKEIESLISDLDTEAARYEKDIASPVIAANFEKLNTVTERHRTAEKKKQELYAEWEAAVELLSTSETA
jgi:ATP-binding cassette subfamily F protein 3